MIVTPISGDVLLLRYMLGFSSPGNIQMRLYNNNFTPNETCTLANFTESTATSYTAATLSGAAWTVTSGSPAGATGTYADVTFPFGSMDTLYGYFITSGSNLLWAEAFNSPYGITSPPQNLIITPRITAD